MGPFALEERLPGAANTFRAVHLQKKRTVAVKLFPIPLGGNPHATSEFIAECELLQRVRSPHIVRSYGGGVEDRYGYLVSAIVEGNSLNTLVNRFASLPWPTVVRYARGIANGLQTAHERGIVHGALISEKIIIDSADQPQILDFRMPAYQNSLFRTTAPASLESACCQAPELLDKSYIPTPKSDLYALGMIIYRMLTGSLPFVAPSIDEMRIAYRHQVVPRVATRVFDCPVGLDAIVAQLVEVDPRKRTHSAAAVMMALDETENQVAHGIGVLEQAAKGISAVRLAVDRQDARKLLGRQIAGSKQSDGPPLYERTWFLTVCLLTVLTLAGLGVVRALRPWSEDEWIAKAEALMASPDKNQWHRAKSEVLEPYLQRFPEGKYVETARQHLDQVDMHTAESMLRLRMRLGRDPVHDGERQYLEAWHLEQFGDLTLALDSYREIESQLSDAGESRPYRNLARRQISALEELSERPTSAEFLERQLKLADDQYASGQKSDAQKIWTTIVKLYRGREESRIQREQALDRLANPRATDTPTSEPPP